MTVTQHEKVKVQLRNGQWSCFVEIEKFTIDNQIDCIILKNGDIYVLGEASFDKKEIVTATYYKAKRIVRLGKSFSGDKT